jgi:arabinoxylan arabinofuranohydrolase
LSNGTFEGGIAGWSAPFGGTLAASADARTGTGAIQISGRTAFQSGPAATVTGRRRPIGPTICRCRSNTGTPATHNVNVTLARPRAARARRWSVARRRRVNGYTLTKTFTPAVDTYDYLFVETPWDTTVASFVVDDASLTGSEHDADDAHVPEVPVVPGNLLPDGRFVDGFTGWQAPRGGTLALTTDAASGLNALKVTGRTNTQSGPFASVTGKLEAGAGYRLSAKLKYTEGPDTQQFNFTFCPANFNGCDDRGRASPRASGIVLEGLRRRPAPPRHGLAVRRDPVELQRAPGSPGRRDLARQDLGRSGRPRLHLAGEGADQADR